MIIGVDGNEANVARRVGIGEYAYELLKQFYALQTPNLEFRIYLKDNPREDLPPQGSHWQYHIVGPRKLWTQFGLPVNLFFKNPKPDVFFTPTHYAPRFSPVPTVVSVMDLSYLYFPKLFNKSDLYQLKNWTKYSVKNAKKVITISKSSKNDIIEEYHAKGDKVAVVYPGIKAKVSLEPHVFPMSELATKYHISDNFILYVGTLQPRKNITRLIEAFSILLQDEKLQEDNLQLVIVGKKGWLYEEILEAPEKYQVANKVKFLDFVSDDELKELYHKARVFVLPSLYEGFGLPVLEAMQYGCPVITSNISSMPEAGGDAAVYVDPKSVSDIADKMKKVVTNETLRKEMIAKGKKQVAKFSWKKSAEETLAILEQVANSKQ